MAKTKKKKSSENLYWLLASLAAGAALVLITDNNSGGLEASGGEKGGSSSPSPTPAKPATPNQQPVPTTPPTPNTPVPAPAQPVLDNTRKEHVIIDSFNGETIYENINEGLLAVFPWKDAIIKLDNRTYIGKLTGRKYKIMAEVTGVIEGTVRRYWVDEKEVQLVTEKELSDLLTYSNVRHMAPDVTKKIDQYFKKF